MNVGSEARRGVPALPVALLRDAVARESARVSLRRAAREIGTSPNGLRNFLNGSTPRLATRAKLEQWLSAKTTASRPPAVGQIVRLLNELGADFSPQQVTALARDIAGLLDAAYAARRLSAPRWVKDLSRRAGRAAPDESESVA